MERITLDIDDDNELVFKVHVEGSDRGTASVRLLCESNNMSLFFNGKSSDDDLVTFYVPALKSVFKPGSYKAKIEVIVENKVFTPMEFDVELQKTVSVVAESVKVVESKKPQQTKVSVESIVVKKVDSKSTAPVLYERMLTKQSKKS